MHSPSIHGPDPADPYAPTGEPTGTTRILEYLRVERSTERITIADFGTSPIETADATVVAEYARTPHVEAIPLGPVVNDAEVMKP